MHPTVLRTLWGVNPSPSRVECQFHHNRRHTVIPASPPLGVRTTHRSTVTTTTTTTVVMPSVSMREVRVAGAEGVTIRRAGETAEEVKECCTTNVAAITGPLSSVCGKKAE